MRDDAAAIPTNTPTTPPVQPGQTSPITPVENKPRLQKYDLVLKNSETGQQTTTTPMNLVEQLGPGDFYDVVLVLVRKNQLRDVLPDLAGNRHSPTFLFMVNSASSPE